MTFDAVVCSREFPTGDEDRDRARNSIFGPLLGSSRVMSREVPSLRSSLVTRHGDQTTMAFPKSDPRHPEYQHDWHEAQVVAGEVRVGDPVHPDALASGGLFVGVKKQ